jgi:DNA-binding winged helix-turn-helix (wHTH) protein/adenylate kinase family enzyme
LEDSLILIIYNEIYFLNIEFISENIYKKKLYINGKNIDLKEREVDVFYLLVSNYNDIVSKETIIRSLLNKKSLDQELLDIDIKYSNNRVSEVIGKIEKLLCEISKKNYIKNLFIQRKSKLGYSLSSDSDFFNDKIVIKKNINLNTNNEIDNFYNEYKNYLFIQNSKYFNSHYNKNTKKEYLEESPNIDFFYGREEEINDIKNKLEKNNLICIYGSGGIGKSYIAKKLVDKIKYDYDIILWKNLRNIHSLESFIEELIYKTSEKKEIIQNNNTEENIDNLIDKIKHKKILIILDNYENILENRNISISYKEKFKDYHTLIEKISSSQETSKSRIIITSREKPKELRENKNFNLKVEWLDYESCNKIILRNGIFSDKTTINEFIYKLGGNPQLINMLSHTIKKVFLGNLTHFFNINSNLTFDIYNFLDEQFNKISQIEQDIMFNITISRKNIDFNYLFDKLSYLSKIDIINYVEILIDRAFISVNDNILSIQNIISEYFNKKLNILVSEEIINNKPNILKKLFLISNIEDIESIESQKTYFISEIVKLLLESLNNLDDLKLKLKNLILLRKNLPIEE